MRILALDTATRIGSCALVRDGRVARELAGDSSRTHAERLPGELMTLLDLERTALPEIDAFAVAVGPGSFTGLRVGIATMQGLSFALHRPLVGVSALDALAHLAQSAASRLGALRIATWVDAWRGDVYAALYEDAREIEPPSVEPPDVLLARLAGTPTIFTGDGAAVYRDRIVHMLGAHAGVTEPAMPVLAGAIAMLAGERLRDGIAPPPQAIRPLYVRRPDAETARDARAPR